MGTGKTSINARIDPGDHLAERFRGRKILITGGAGFIGSTLAARLVDYGANVTLVDSLIPDAPLVGKYGRADELKRLTPGRPIIFVDPSYFRPADVVSLIGDAAKARRELGWVPEISFDELVEEMVDWDFRDACREAVCRASGYPLPDSVEERM